MWHETGYSLNAGLTDAPPPTDIPDYPSGAQVLAYLESYADHFGLLPHCRFRTALRRIDRLSNDDGWALEIDTLGSGGEVTGSRVESFDKVVIATGPYTKPYLPKIEGMEGFKGEVIHAQGYKSYVQFPSSALPWSPFLSLPPPSSAFLRPSPPFIASSGF